VDVDVDLPAPRTSHNAWLRADARGGHGSFREKLAEGVSIEEGREVIAELVVSLTLIADWSVKRPDNG
jgi:hypothetical protein